MGSELDEFELGMRRLWDSIRGMVCFKAGVGRCSVGWLLFMGAGTWGARQTRDHRRSGELPVEGESGWTPIGG